MAGGTLLATLYIYYIPTTSPGFRVEYIEYGATGATRPADPLLEGLREVAPF